MFPLHDENPTRIRPVVTIGLILANLWVFFFVQPIAPRAAAEEFLYREAAISCEIVTGHPLTAEEIVSGRCRVDEGEPVFPDKNPFLSVLASMFLHGGVAHVLFNMWFLWIFGNNVEEAYGRVGYIFLYLLGGIAAAFGFVALNPGSTVPLVGASGAIAAILGAYAVLYPRHAVISLVGWWVLPVPAILFLGVWFVAQFGLGGTNVAWEAHVGGFIFGLVVTLFQRRRLLRRVYSYARAR
ncbi:MAG: rhomboid family intramembrane serine protease [Acidimicrobiia bacterium]